MKRSEFIQTGLLGTALYPFSKTSLLNNEGKKKFPKLTFGACADIHHDFYPNVPAKLTRFIADMEKKSPDFIVQLGDFCRPEPKNMEIMDIWNRFDGPKLHVIGNHDPEMIFTQEEVARFWGMPAPYYSLDIKEYHLVILDGNEVNPAHEKRVKYERYITNKQLQWLEADLESTDKYTMIFCHQAIDIDGLENSLSVRVILDRVNQKAGFQKVQAVFSGHHHRDFYNNINGIHYFQINSMCYDWNPTYADNPYDEETTKKYPLVKKMNHYKDPIWAYVEISENGQLKFTGKKSVFLGKSPYENGMPRQYDYEVKSEISDKLVFLEHDLLS
jgi:calcineurin-like phosphoesterase family protein